jgi:CheY-like chemotaxis protein
LVVDDDADSRQLLSDAIGYLGYEVFVAEDAIEALEEMHAALPDLVILDLMMPRLDGFWLIEELKRIPKLSRVPIIIASALSDAEWPTAGGVSARLQKPINFEELHEVVQRVLAEADTSDRDRRHTHVLVIEDDADFRTILADALGALGIPVATAWNRTKAAEELDAGLRPVAIVMDLMMPGMDADTFTAALDGLELWHTPMVVISAASEVDVPTPARALRRLRKPIDLGELVQILKPLT